MNALKPPKPEVSMKILQCVLLVLSLSIVGCGSSTGGGSSTGSGTGDATGNSVGTGDATDVSVCTPVCDGKQCGDDQCGGSCGTCVAGEVCDPNGSCRPDTGCSPDCAGKQCGSDLCGGSCGTCDAGKECTDLGLCAAPTECVPSCVGKACGDDGCGGQCGECAQGETCSALGACETSSGPSEGCGECYPGTVCGANPAAPTWCSGGSCGDITLTGKCTDDNSIVAFCNTETNELVSINCVFLSAGSQPTECGFDPNGDGGNGWYDCLAQPDCDGKTCGPDGAGGTCGECGTDEQCSAEGVCEFCQWQCDGKVCGSNGCGGTCGECAEGTICDTAGQCLDPASLPGNTCETALPLTAGGEVSGDTTVGTSNFSTESDACGENVTGVGAESNDHVYTLTPPDTAVYTFELTGDFDAALYVLSDCTAGENACQASVDGFGDTETLIVELTGGTSYSLVVDGWSNFSNVSGTYTLTMSEPCYPACENKTCGSNGCGGTCGSCDEGTLCETDGTCLNANEVTGNTCNLPFDITAVPFTTTGDGDNATNAYDAAGCMEPITETNEQVYVFVPDVDGIYSVALETSSFTRGLYVADACPAPADTGPTAVTCTAGASGDIVYAALTAGTPYHVFVEVNASYTLDINSCTPSCEGKVCGSDGCGSSCGDCGESEACVQGACQATSDDSCVGRCGNYNTELPCQCDSACFSPEYDDCCEDICTACQDDFEAECAGG